MTNKLNYEVRYTTHEKPYDIKRDIVACADLADALDCFEPELRVLDVEIVMPVVDLAAWVAFAGENKIDSIDIDDQADAMRQNRFGTSL